MTTVAAAPASGFIGRVPVRNIWLLLLYASHLYRELPEAQRVALEEAADDIPELVAELLADAVERRMRRNLAVGYQWRTAVLNRVRGRIDLLRTERHQLLQRGQVACTFDELTVDTPRNRCVKEALLLLAKALSKPARQPQDRERAVRLERRCRELARRLEHAGVQNESGARRVSGQILRSGAGWMDTEERRMLAAARLAFDLAIPTEQAGNALMAMADRDANPGWRLYEYAVAGFYDTVLSSQGWRIKHGHRLGWPVENPTSELESILPGMVADIVLERRSANNGAQSRRIVIDTKFMSIVTGGWQRERSLRSGNIYQMYAYLRSQESPEDPLSRNSTGVLLYPSLGEDYDQAGTIQGHRIRFATVDLAADTQTIRSQLLRIVEDQPQPGG